MTLARGVLFSLLGFLVACSDRPRPAQAIGEAYVGPSTLNLRQELASKSPVAVSVQHGDKLEVLEYRHRLVRVRTAKGVEGWTDMRQLLTPEQMAGLKQMAEKAEQYPSQGIATVYESLNMHTEPNRQSPGFWQIPENGKVDVIGHKLVPRAQAASVAAPAPVKQAAPARRSREKGQTKIGPPPPGPAPKPPENWVALSVPKPAPPEGAEAEIAASQQSARPPSVPMEDWSLVRTKDGKAGWVLTRPLSMAIPDEVAQYAEGHRITSYFPLGAEREGSASKNNWLWTTITKGQQPYEFDSFRVFVWSTRHHRYETAYIERNVIGHFPVAVDTSHAVPSFSVVLEGNDGRLYRKTYSFEGFRIRMIKKEPSGELPRLEAPVQTAKAPVPAPPATRSWYARLKDRMSGLFR